MLEYARTSKNRSGTRSEARRLAARTVPPRGRALPLLARGHLGPVPSLLLSPHRQEDARLLCAVNVNDRLPRALQHYRNARLSVCLKQATFFTFPLERFKSLNRKL